MEPGELIRRARKRQNIKQSELARRAKTTQSAISRVEREERSPTIAYLERLLGAMGEELRLDSVRPRRRSEGSNPLYRKR